MEHQARAWVFQRLLSLHTIWKTHFIDVMQSGRQLNDTQVTVKIDHQAMMVINRILDLYVEADIGIRTRTDGFHMVHGIHRLLAGAVSGEKSTRQLNKIYGKIEKARVAALRNFLKTVLAQGEAQVSQNNPMPRFMKPVTRVTNREFAHKKCQPEFENPLALKTESWIRDVSDDNAATFGFVIYRISYTQSNEQWIKFLGLLEEGLNSSWEGYVDVESAKKKATLEWVDGREYNMAEGDLNAVRK